MIASVLRTSTLTAALAACASIAVLLGTSAPALAAEAVHARGAASAVQADTSVSPADIQRLQDRAYTLGSDLSRLRTRDSSQASRYEADLDDLRDEVIYLKVKLRKEGRVPRAEYTDLRDRLDSLGARIRGERDPAPPPTTSSTTGSSTSGSGTYQPRGTVAAERPGDTRPADTRPVERERDTTSRPAGVEPSVADDSRSTRSTGSRRGVREIPVGTELDIRLQTPLSSETAQVEDRFEATTIVDLLEGNELLVPAGSVMRGVVSSVKKAGRLERKGSMTLSFDQLTVDGRDYTVRATVTQALESGGYRSDAGKIGAGAGVGAIIGGILGGFKGALAGILIGGGGTIAATEGKDVKLDTGTILRVRFDSPVPLEGTSSRR